MFLKKRFTYANVAATLALVLAVGGGGAAFAALGKNTVGTKQIINSQVKAPDIGRSAVKSAKLANGSVTAPKLGANAVSSTKIKDGSVGPNDLAASSKLGQAKVGAFFTSAPALNAHFNKFGGAPVAERPGTGHYEINVPGHSSGASDIIVVSPNDAASCHAFAFEGEYVVMCEDDAGAPKNVGFSFLVY